MERSSSIGFTSNRSSQVPRTSASSLQRLRQQPQHISSNQPDVSSSPSTSSQTQQTPIEYASADALSAQRALRQQPALPATIDRPDQLFTTPVNEKLITIDRTSPHRHIDEHVQEWANANKVNTNNLLDIKGQVTRYGVVEIGGIQFIIGPHLNEEEYRDTHVFQRFVDHYPQIGHIFGVDADLDTRDQTSRPRYVNVNSYCSRQTGENIAYQEFSGIKKGNASPEAYWQAGYGIAQFIKHYPEKVVMICSDEGLSRPCAVAISAIILLKANDFVKISREDFKQALQAAAKSIKEQRSANFSASDLLQNLPVFRENFDRLHLINHIRHHGLWDNQVMDMVPPMITQTDLLVGRALVIQDEHGNIMHRYSEHTEEEHNEAAMHSATPEDIYLFHLNVTDADTGESFLHYEVGNRNSQPWNRTVTVAPDGDCFFRALHRAIPINLRQYGMTEREAISRYRNTTADYLIANIDRVEGFMFPASTLEQVRWHSDSLGSATIKDIRIPQLNIGYRNGGARHTDMIAGTEIDDSKASSIVRTIFLAPNDQQLTTDNKFFDKESILNLYTHLYTSSPILLNEREDFEAYKTLKLEELERQGVLQGLQACNALGTVELTHPTTRVPLLGFLNNQDELHDVEMLLGEGYYTIHSISQPSNRLYVDPNSQIPLQNHVYRLPKLPIENRMISFITDAKGKIVGGPEDGKMICINNYPLNNAVFFQPVLGKGLVCYTDPITHEHRITHEISDRFINLCEKYTKEKYTALPTEQTPAPASMPSVQTDAQRLQIVQQRTKWMGRQFITAFSNTEYPREPYIDPDVSRRVRLTQRRLPLTAIPIQASISSVQTDEQRLQRVRQRTLSVDRSGETSIHRPASGIQPGIGYTTFRRRREDEPQQSVSSNNRLLGRLRNLISKPRISQPQNCAAEANVRQISNRREDDPDAGPGSNIGRRRPAWLQQLGHCLPGQTGGSNTVNPNHQHSGTQHIALEGLALCDAKSMVQAVVDIDVASKQVIQWITAHPEFTLEMMGGDVSIASTDFIDASEQSLMNSGTKVSTDKESDLKTRRRAVKDFNQQYKQPLLAAAVVHPSIQSTTLSNLSSSEVSSSMLANRPEIQQVVQSALRHVVKQQTDTDKWPISISYSGRLPPSYISVSHESERHSRYHEPQRYSLSGLSAVRLDKQNTSSMMASHTQAELNREERKALPNTNRHLAIEYPRK